MTRKKKIEKQHGMQENQHMRYGKRSEKQDFEIICENEIDCFNRNDELSITLEKHLETIFLDHATEFGNRIIFESREEIPVIKVSLFLCKVTLFLLHTSPLKHRVCHH